MELVVKCKKFVLKRDIGFEQQIENIARRQICLNCKIHGSFWFWFLPWDGSLDGRQARCAPWNEKKQQQHRN
jgi:hypothetical protein